MHSFVFYKKSKTKQLILLLNLKKKRKMYSLHNWMLSNKYRQWIFILFLYIGCGKVLCILVTLQVRLSFANFAPIIGSTIQHFDNLIRTLDCDFFIFCNCFLINWTSFMIYPCTRYLWSCFTFVEPHLFANFVGEIAAVLKSFILTNFEAVFGYGGNGTVS